MEGVRDPDKLRSYCVGRKMKTTTWLRVAAVLSLLLALDWALFFVVPTVFNLIISICLALAWLAGARKNH
jgi:hypothetical protein